MAGVLFYVAAIVRCRENQRLRLGLIADPLHKLDEYHQPAKASDRFGCIAQKDLVAIKKRFTRGVHRSVRGEGNTVCICNLIFPKAFERNEYF